jgi:hypothetical protein
LFASTSANTARDNKPSPPAHFTLKRRERRAPLAPAARLAPGKRLDSHLPDAQLRRREPSRLQNLTANHYEHTTD